MSRRLDAVGLRADIEGPADARLAQLDDQQRLISEQLQLVEAENGRRQQEFEQATADARATFRPGPPVPDFLPDQHLRDALHDNLAVRRRLSDERQELLRVAHVRVEESWQQAQRELTGRAREVIQQLEELCADGRPWLSLLYDVRSASENTADRRVRNGASTRTATTLDPAGLVAAVLAGRPLDERREGVSGFVRSE